MSYRQHLGAFNADKILIAAGKMLEGASPTAGALARVAADPYFPELACQFIRLQNVAEGKPAGRCAPTPRGKPGGVGLESAILPLKALVLQRQHPWVIPTVVAGVLFIAYKAGQNSVRST